MSFNSLPRRCSVFSKLRLGDTVIQSKAAVTGLIRAAKEIAEQGSFKRLAESIPFAEINGTFARG